MTDLELLELWSKVASGECDLEHDGKDRPEDRSYTARIRPGPMQQTGARLKWYGIGWSFDEGTEGTLIVAALGFAWARGWHFSVSAVEWGLHGQKVFGTTVGIASTLSDDLPQPTVVAPEHFAWYLVREYVRRLPDPYPRLHSWKKGSS